METPQRPNGYSVSTRGRGAVPTFQAVNEDCLEYMETLPENFFHSCVTDPPYHLSIAKRFSKTSVNGTTKTEERCAGRTDGYARLARGFMGQEWDGGDIAFRPETWEKVLRILRPGGHLLCFGGTRTFHRMACAIEDAGFEIRDTLMWVYGSGMPKSHNLHDDWEGWGTALKPAWEPIFVARKPLTGTVAKNALEYSCGAINIDGCRIESNDSITIHTRNSGENHVYNNFRVRPNGQTAGQTVGRWPANLVHDGSDEVINLFPDSVGQLAKARTDGSPEGNKVYSPKNHFTKNPEPRGDNGSSARFFYCAKASKEDRFGSNHPTVKPISLMRWLVRLSTVRGGNIIDPFAGSGTTLAAAYLEGMNALGIEREETYFRDIVRRMEALAPSPSAHGDI